MNSLDVIKELYNMYSDEETSPWVVEVTSEGMDLESDLENGLADLYLEL